MRAPRRPYPSFTLVLTQHSYPVCLPAYGVARTWPYTRSKPCRMLDLEDSLMRTIDARHNSQMQDNILAGIRDSDSDTLLSLEDALSSKVAGSRMRRLSLSTLVLDLALAVRRNLEKLRVVEKEDVLDFPHFTQ